MFFGGLTVNVNGRTVSRFRSRSAALVLAYLAMARPGYEADRFRIVLRQWPSGEEV